MSEFWLGGAIGFSSALILVWIRDLLRAISARLGERIAEYEIRKIEDEK